MRSRIPSATPTNLGKCVGEHSQAFLEHVHAEQKMFSAASIYRMVLSGKVSEEARTCGDS